MPAPFPVSPTRLALAVSLAFPLCPVVAQTTTPETQLDAVTVTADRRAEPIKNVPMAVSTLSGEKLDVITSGGQDVRALAARVPSLNIESSFGRAFPRFYIRGYGNTDFRLNASQPVSLVYDDVVQENPILKGFPIFDLEQVEVLRGPQGTLFGRNSPAGVVKFDSVKPGRDVEGYGSVSWATYNTVNVEGAVNTPLGEAWSCCTSRTRISVRCSTCTGATSTGRHGCSAPTSSSPARTTSWPASTRARSRRMAGTSRRC
jgi:iron complex outermembrane receptor protein